MDASNLLKPMLARGELPLHRRDHARRVPQAHREGRRARAALPAGAASTSRRVEETISILRGLQGALRGPPRRPDHGRARSSRPRRSRTATSPTASCPTRRSTSSTRPPAACAWRSTRMPAELDELERRRHPARDRARGARKETGRAPSKAASRRIERRARASSQEQAGAMKQRWEAEKARHRPDLRSAKEELEQAPAARSSRPSARPTTARAAELKYGDTRRARQERMQAQRGGARRVRRRRRALLKEEVDADDIAEVVAKWTGIPVEPPARGREREAPPDGGRARTSASSARTRRCARSRNAVRRARAGLQRPATGRSARFLFLGPDRRRQDRARPGARRVPLRRRAAPWSAST